MYLQMNEHKRQKVSKGKQMSQFQVREITRIEKGDPDTDLQFTDAIQLMFNSDGGISQFNSIKLAAAQ